MAAMARYLALTARIAVPSGSSLLHLVHKDAEAALCGIPRVTLGQGGKFDQVVCPDCIEWLPKLAAEPGPFRNAQPQ
jgi:hypothetical protein